MDDTEQLVTLLTEIRDGQREHLAEYRRIAEHSVQLQEAAIARYRQMMRVYLVVVAIVAIVLVCLVAYLIVAVFL